MSELLPSILLVTMIIVTLVLLPYLNNERSGISDEPRRATEELHVKPRRKE